LNARYQSAQDAAFPPNLTSPFLTEQTSRESSRRKVKKDLRRRSKEALQRRRMSDHTQEVPFSEDKARLMPCPACMASNVRLVTTIPQRMPCVATIRAKSMRYAASAQRPGQATHDAFEYRLPHGSAMKSSGIHRRRGEV
jgi:hypothetical protein